MEKTGNQQCIMVCVTPQSACSRLIAAGARIAKEKDLPLKVISVFRESSGLNANAGGALETLYECARAYDAGMDIYFNDSPALVVAVAAKKRNRNACDRLPCRGQQRIHRKSPRDIARPARNNGRRAIKRIQNNSY